MHYYLDILFNTKKTIQRIGCEEIKHRVSVPFLINSIAAGFPAMRDMELSGNENIFWISISFFFGAGLTYLGLMYVMPGFYFVLSRIFRGSAGYRDIQLVFSLVFIPEIIVVLDQFLKLVINSSPYLPEPHPILATIVYVLTLRILIIGLAYFNKITFHKAFVIILSSMIPLPIIYWLATG